MYVCYKYYMYIYIESFDHLITISLCEKREGTK